MNRLWRWLVTLGWGVIIFYLTTLPNFRPVSDSLLSSVLSIGGHFFFFGVQAILLSLALSPSIYNLASSFCLTVLYGLVIELIQRTVPGRSFSLWDLLLDGLGAITFLAIARKNFQSQILKFSN